MIPTLPSMADPTPKLWPSKVTVIFPRSVASNGLIDTILGAMYVKLLVRNVSDLTP